MDWLSADSRRWVFLAIGVVVLATVLWLAASLLDPSSDPAALSRGDFGSTGDLGAAAPARTVLLPGSTAGGAG